MLATQGQEFWGGRWALAARTRGDPSVRDVDAAFDRGEIVRSWTMRGTIHVIPARDLAWVLVAHGRAAAPRRPRAVHRVEAIDDAELARAERLVRGGAARRQPAHPQGAVRRARGGRRLAPRASAAITCSSRCRCARVVCQGPVVPREGGPTREQYIVLHRRMGDGCRVPGRSARRVLRPLHRLARPGRRARLRVVVGAAARGLARGGGGGIRSPRRRRRRRRAAVRRRRARAAAQRRRRPTCSPCRRTRSTTSRTPTAPCRARRSSSRAIGPSLNGIVRPILVARGEVVGVWTHSVAVGRHADDPIPELFAPGAATDAEIGAALDRYRAFITA